MKQLTPNVQSRLREGIASNTISIVNEALARGANPNDLYFNDEDEAWPLIFTAAENFDSHPEILQALLKAGANPNAQIRGVHSDDEKTFNSGETLWSALDWHIDGLGVENIPDFLKMLMKYNKDPNLEIVEHPEGRRNAEKMPIMDYLRKHYRNDLSDEDLKEIQELYNDTIFFKEQREKMGQLKRNIVGHPKTIQYMRSTILDRPDSAKMRAFRATNPRWRTSVEDMTNLCSDLNSEMYKDELYDLAVDLDIPVTKKTNKGELCRLISQWYTEHEKVAE